MRSIIFLLLFVDFSRPSIENILTPIHLDLLIFVVTAETVVFANLGLNCFYLLDLGLLLGSYTISFGVWSTLLLVLFQNGFIHLRRLLVFYHTFITVIIVSLGRYCGLWLMLCRWRGDRNSRVLWLVSRRELVGEVRGRVGLGIVLGKGLLGRCLGGLELLWKELLDLIVLCLIGSALRLALSVGGSDGNWNGVFLGLIRDYKYLLLLRLLAW